MRLFLIDYENVNSAGLEGIGQLTQQDRVILFYSQSANTLSFDIMDEMLAAGVMPERVCIAQSGKNALDFQLVTFLGYLIAKNTADEYYIISRDAGYTAAAAFCRSNLGAGVTIRPSIRAVLKSTAQPESSAQKREKKKAAISLRKKATVVQVQPVIHTEAVPAPAAMQTGAMTMDTLRSLLPHEVGAENAAQIFACLTESHSKTEFHNALQQSFSNEDSKLYYHCLKPCFAAAFSG
ncbi:MAG: hypothetical protein IJC75_00580 [Oscillospiraceae bacterium]|nr:hypothetical protein [Oscillospiraceae bacterium]